MVLSRMYVEVLVIDANQLTYADISSVRMHVYTDVEAKVQLMHELSGQRDVLRASLHTLECALSNRDSVIHNMKGDVKAASDRADVAEALLTGMR